MKNLLAMKILHITIVIIPTWAYAFCMAIPIAVWRAETQHKKIWESAGLCVKCHSKPREMLCSRCHEPMCAGCLTDHQKGADHARDIYIERLAKNMMPWTNSTAEECAEARLLQDQWRDDTALAESFITAA